MSRARPPGTGEARGYTYSNLTRRNTAMFQHCADWIRRLCMINCTVFRERSAVTHGHEAIGDEGLRGGEAPWDPHTRMRRTHMFYPGIKKKSPPTTAQAVA